MVLGFSYGVRLPLLLRLGCLRPRSHVPSSPLGSSVFLSAAFSSRPLGPRREWTQSEEEKLLEYRAQGLDRAAIASNLRRSEESIKSKLRSLRLKNRLLQYSKILYSAAEDQQIRDMIQKKLKRSQMHEAMPDRSLASLDHRVRMLRGDHTQASPPGSRAAGWTVDEENTLLEHCKQGSLSEIAKHFPSRTMSALYTKLSSLKAQAGLPRGMPRYQPWIQAEDSLLVDMLSDGAQLEAVATALSRTVPSVRARASRLRAGVTTSKGRQWSPEEIQKVKDLRAQSKTVSEIAALLPDRTFGAVQRLCYYLKIAAPDQ